MKKIMMIILGILVLPGSLLGYILLRYRHNRASASRFYDAAGHPRDDGTRLVLPRSRRLRSCRSSTGSRRAPSCAACPPG